jgi:hypothetical protein
MSVDSYFQQNYDCTRLRGLSARQKLVAAIWILTYGLPADVVDEYVQIEESTAHGSLDHFCRVVIDAFGKECLHSPNTADVTHLLQVGEARGFSGMLGSIDCMHCEWSCCPSAWKGFFHRMWEAPIHDLRGRDIAWFVDMACLFWPSFNVLQRSPILLGYEWEESPPIQFTTKGRTYDMGYYLTDDIYLEWSTFMKIVSHPTDRKKQYFAKV